MTREQLKKIVDGVIDFVRSEAGADVRNMALDYLIAELERLKVPTEDDLQLPPGEPVLVQAGVPIGFIHRKLEDFTGMTESKPMTYGRLRSVANSGEDLGPSMPISVPTWSTLQAGDICRADDEVGYTNVGKPICEVLYWYGIGESFPTLFLNKTLVEEDFRGRHFRRKKVAVDSFDFANTRIDHKTGPWLSLWTQSAATHRDLDQDEVIQEGDEFIGIQSINGQDNWSPCSCASVGSKPADWTKLKFRRPLKGASGSIEFAEKPAEKRLEIVVEPKWQALKPGDVRQAGDEVRFMPGNAGWQPIWSATYGQAYVDTHFGSWEFRRPVTADDHKELSVIDGLPGTSW